MTDQEKLLEHYGEMSGPEAGPWNLGVENKYLEYRITSWFEENFPVSGKKTICNIGIGAGYWDRYLSYRISEGELISIDIDSACCEMLRLGLQNEKNPNRVRIICSDVMRVNDLKESCEIVTMIGSTRMESGLYDAADKSDLQSKIDSLKNALNGQDINLIKNEKEALTQAFYKISEKLYQQAQAAQGGAQGGPQGFNPNDFAGGQQGGFNPNDFNQGGGNGDGYTDAGYTDANFTDAN